MLKYQIYQSQLKGSTAYGKFYCRVVSNKTMSVADVAEHMHNHHTPFSSGTIQGILADAVACTRELLLEGKRVSWDNLASFGLSVEHNMGAETADDFSVAKHVKNVKLIAQGVGSFSKSYLNGKASLKEAKDYVSPKTSMSGGSTNPGGSEDTGGDNPGGGSGDEGGSENPTTYTLTLMAGNGGTVTGAGDYEAGTEVEIKAVANSGYTFEKWSDGDTNATRTITVNSDLSLTATFKSDGGDDTPPFS